MKWKGKVDLWFLVIVLLGEALVVSSLLTSESGKGFGIIITIFYNIIVLPFIIRNYVKVSDEEVIVAFGFSKNKIAISEIQEMYTTHNPISSSAASLDRIVIRGKQKTIMCAVHEKETFFNYLKEKNPNIIMKNTKKEKRKHVLETVSILFCFISFVAVAILLFTGDIEIKYEKNSFTINATYWNDKEIKYEDIESIKYSDEKIPGSRVGGFGSFRLLMGDFKNAEFGNYTRYTYTKSDAGVVLVVKGREVVIGGEDKESTRAIYEELLKRWQK